MSEPKNESPKEDIDWADALDEWEQKAFASVRPPPAAPAASTADSPDASPSEPVLEDGTLASAGSVDLDESAVDASFTSVEVIDAALLAAAADGDVEVVEVAVSEPPGPRRTAPPPLPETAFRAAPPLPSIRIDEAPLRSIAAPRPSLVTGALRALAFGGDDEAALSRLPMPSMRQVGTDIASLLHEEARWLETEARSAPEAARANILLALSEVHAILGEAPRAHAFATEARTLAPGLPLAHWQARVLDGSASGEADDLLAEEAAATEPAHKRHAALLAADVLRFAGDADGAVLRLGQMAETGDIRGLVGRAAIGLSLGDNDGLQAVVAQPLARPIADGLTTTLRLRGAPIGQGGAPSSPDGVTDALEGARKALASGAALKAAHSIATLRAVPELAAGATWLGSALAAVDATGRGAAISWLSELAQAGDPRATRALAARAIEADDAGAVASALKLTGLSAADDVALGALLEVEGRASKSDLPTELGPLAAAVASVDMPAHAEDVTAAEARAGRVVGSPSARAAQRLARLLASSALVIDLESAVAPLRESSPEIAEALDLELALRGREHSRVSDLLQRRGSDRTGQPRPVSQARPADASLAAALVAERAGDTARALAAYRDARALNRSSDVALRAVASLQPSTDLPGELNELADELGSTSQGALARLEAVIREDSVDDATRAELLERAHLAAPQLPFAAFMAERIALRGGNVDEVLRWIGERRAAGADATEVVVDTVREARLLARREPDGSSSRIKSAHAQRPNDLALRGWYERTEREAPDDRAAYWEAQAQECTSSGDSRALLYLEVAHAYERSGDNAGILRVAGATGSDSPLLSLARDRAELEGGEAARLVDQLLADAKGTNDPIVRREAYERLADIDRVGRGDTTSARLWHQSIVEETTHLPSLRYLEHALISEGRDDELEPIVTAVAHALLGEGEATADGGERVAHADLAARLRSRGPDGDWESTFDLAALAGSDPVPSLAALRLLHAHARVRKDDDRLIRVSEQLLDRATRPVEMAALRLRVAEAAFRQNDLAQALTSLEQSTAEDPGDLVAFRLLAEVRHASGEDVGAAEAHEAVARLSLVPAHQLDAWYDAARLYLADPDQREQAVHALEQAAVIDLKHEDVFERLSALYSARGAHTDLAALLVRRIALASTADERVTLEVDRARALLAAGDRAASRAAIDAALAERPEHTTALATFGDLSALDQDWTAAEDAWVRLARLLATPDEQRAIYERLGDLYSTKAVHLERAELAFKEVLKRVPGDVRTTERLIDVYRRQRDVSRAVDAQQELLAKATTAQEKRNRTIELSRLHEDPGHDERRAEQVLEAARREYPTDVVVLRALAEFYARHKQTPALNILLDRTTADTKRAFAAGRFAPALFEIMGAVFELRDQTEPARIVGASLLAIEGKTSEVRGAFGPALDVRLDELLAPEVLSPGLRALLTRAGSMLDMASPLDLRAVGAQPAGPEARMIHELAGSFATGLGLVAPKIYVSKTVGRTCLPAASDPPALVVGEPLLTATNERAVAFLVMRAMKLVAARASALVRTTSTDLAALVPAWLQGIAPAFTPQGLNPTALAAAAKKIAATTPPPASEELTSLALEVAAQLGTRASTLGGHATAWANRAALLGIGDPTAALEAIAWSLGAKDGAPVEAANRTAWIGRTHEAKDLLIFSVGDNYAEARARLGLRA